MSQVIARSEIIEVRTDGVTCLLCGKDMECAGTHFARAHGLPVHRRMSRTDRLKAYGLPAGTRLSSQELRAEFSRKHPKDGIPGQHIFQVGNTARNPQDLPQSDAQRAAFRRLIESDKHGSHFVHERAKKERVCAMCGAKFTLPRWVRNKTCSPACAKKQWEQIRARSKTPEARAKAGRAISAIRKVKYWSSR